MFYLQIQWIEEEHDIFAFVVRQADVLEVSIHHSCSTELWCWLSDLHLRHDVGIIGHLRQVKKDVTLLWNIQYVTTQMRLRAYFNQNRSHWDSVVYGCEILN